MPEKNNAVCSICGTPYYACLSCKDAMKLHPYKMHTCSASHFQVFQVVKGYSTGVYNKDEFKSKLKNLDLSDLDTYRDHIKTLIKDTLKEDEVTKEPVVEPVVEVVQDVIDEKPVYSRKKNYRVDKEIENLCD